VRLAASAPAPSERQPAAGEPTEDLVPVPVGRPYVWPSGISLVVPAPTTSASRSAAAVVRVWTTVFNESLTLQYRANVRFEAIVVGDLRPSPGST